MSVVRHFSGVRWLAFLVASFAAAVITVSAAAFFGAAETDHACQLSATTDSAGATGAVTETETEKADRTAPRSDSPPGDITAADADDATASQYWPQWRGPLGTGVAPHPQADPPIEWSEQKNVRWKIALPGKGHSTPIIWGERVFLTAAVPFGEAVDPITSNAPGAHNIRPITQRHKFVVIAVDRRNGEVLWQRPVREQLPFEGVHVTSSLASASPITDGEHVFAFFGSYGLAALDMEGRLLWEKDLGDMQTLHSHGEGSSPALHGRTLIVNWDHEGDSFLLALNKRTGEQLWKVRREPGTSWTTPVIVTTKDGRPQVIVSGSTRVMGYDLATGEMIWRCAGLSKENVVSSPVAGDGIVYTGSTYDRQSMLAIRFDGAQGDITGTDHVVWRRARGAPYVPSPLLYDDALYYLHHFQGILVRVHAQTGEDQPGPMRLDGLRQVFASPVGAAGRVYITDRDGRTVVISHDIESRVLALNQLDDAFSASPAIVGDDLFLRGERHLYRITRDN